MKLKIYRLIKVIFISFFIMFLVSYVWDHYVGSPNNMQKYVESPNNNYVAYVYERNGGATTPFVYHLSILEKGKRLPRNSGNVIISYIEFDVEWVKSNELKVAFLPSHGKKNIFKKLEHIEGIKITYSNLPSEY